MTLPELPGPPLPSIPPETLASPAAGPAPALVSHPSLQTLQWPLTILSGAFAIFLASGVAINNGQQQTLRAQLTAGATLAPQLSSLEQQLSEGIEQQKARAADAAHYRQQFNGFLQDLVDLSKDDKDAREIINTVKLPEGAILGVHPPTP